jgi:predicted PurR-regulated permease PerM
MNPEDQNLTVMQDESSATAGTFLRAGPTGMSGAQRKASIAVVLLLLVAGIFTLKDFLPALAWAGIFAIGLWPLRDRLSARWPRHRRTLLPALLTLAALLVFVIPVVMIAVPLIGDAHAANEWIAQAKQSGVPPPAALADLPYGAKLTELWQTNIGHPGGLSALAEKGAHGSLAMIGRKAAEAAFHRLVLLGFMLVGLFFLLRDGEEFALELRIGGKRAFGQAGEDVGEQIVRSVRGTVNGLVLVGLAEGIILGVAYAALGVPHPALFGIMTALLAMIPFGAPVAFLIAAATLLLAGDTLPAAAIVVLGTVVTFVADHFFRPVLIGGATRLPFLWVLLGILGGVEAWGLVGLFVGPAIMAALVQLWGEWVGSRSGPINPPIGDASIPD